MQETLDSADREFLQRLHPLGAASISQLCDMAGVTPTAIRQRVNRLLQGGWIERRTVKAARGRPHHMYQLAERGRRSLGNNYAELTTVLWQEIQNIEDLDVRHRVEERVRESLARLYRQKVASEDWQGRLGELAVALGDQGLMATVVQNEGLPVLREASCPYLDLAARDSSICELEQHVFEDVVGVPLKLVSCCRDGSGACEFHPDVAARPAESK